MNLIESIVLGVVEGITEYLPVSSTGHLILTSWLLGLDRPETRDAVNDFEVIIQGGAILAVVGLYWPRIVSMLRGLVGKDARGLRLLLLVVVAVLPAAVLGKLFGHAIKDRLFQPLPVIIALFCGGVILIVLKRWQEAMLAKHATEGATSKTIEDLTFREAFIVGLMQCVAMWPGTSRSMMTIIGGMVVGLPPARAAEFSFLVGCPTLPGACLLTAHDQYKEHGSGMIDALGGWTPVIVGLVVATITAAISIRWLVAYLGRHSLAIFGWWRIAVAILFAGLILSGHLTIEPPAKKASTAVVPGVPSP